MKLPLYRMVLSSCSLKAAQELNIGSAQDLGREELTSMLLEGI